ncbi:MAG: hypothetical protein WC444_03050 [Candidatus Paceibacterota bacterium]
MGKDNRHGPEGPPSKKDPRKNKRNPGDPYYELGDLGLSKPTPGSFPSSKGEDPYLVQPPKGIDPSVPKTPEPRTVPKAKKVGGEVRSKALLPEDKLAKNLGDELLKHEELFDADDALRLFEALEKGEPTVNHENYKKLLTAFDTVYGERKDLYGRTDDKSWFDFAIGEEGELFTLFKSIAETKNDTEKTELLRKGEALLAFYKQHVEQLKLSVRPATPAPAPTIAGPIATSAPAVAATPTVATPAAAPTSTITTPTAAPAPSFKVETSVPSRFEKGQIFLLPADHISEEAHWEVAGIGKEGLTIRQLDKKGAPRDEEIPFGDLKRILREAFNKKENESKFKINTLVTILNGDKKEVWSIEAQKGDTFTLKRAPGTETREISLAELEKAFSEFEATKAAAAPAPTITTPEDAARALALKKLSPKELFEKFPPGRHFTIPDGVNKGVWNILSGGNEGVTLGEVGEKKREITMNFVDLDKAITEYEEVKAKEVAAGKVLRAAISPDGIKFSKTPVGQLQKALYENRGNDKTFYKAYLEWENNWITNNAIEEYRKEFGNIKVSPAQVADTLKILSLYKKMLLLRSEGKTLPADLIRTIEGNILLFARIVTASHDGKDNRSDLKDLVKSYKHSEDLGLIENLEGIIEKVEPKVAEGPEPAAKDEPGTIEKKVFRRAYDDIGPTTFRYDIRKGVLVFKEKNGASTETPMQGGLWDSVTRTFNAYKKFFREGMTAEQRALKREKGEELIEQKDDLLDALEQGNVTLVFERGRDLDELLKKHNEAWPEQWKAYKAEQEKKIKAAKGPETFEEWVPIIRKEAKGYEERSAQLKKIMPKEDWEALDKQVADIHRLIDMFDAALKEKGTREERKKALQKEIDEAIAREETPDDKIKELADLVILGNELSTEAKALPEQIYSLMTDFANKTDQKVKILETRANVWEKNVLRPKPAGSAMIKLRNGDTVTVEEWKKGLAAKGQTVGASHSGRFGFEKETPEEWRARDAKRVAADKAQNEKAKEAFNEKNEYTSGELDIEGVEEKKTNWEAINKRVGEYLDTYTERREQYSADGKKEVVYFMRPFDKSDFRRDVVAAKLTALFTPKKDENGNEILSDALAVLYNERYPENQNKEIRLVVESDEEYKKRSEKERADNPMTRKEVYKPATEIIKEEEEVTRRSIAKAAVKNIFTKKEEPDTRTEEEKVKELLAEQEAGTDGMVTPTIENGKPFALPKGELEILEAAARTERAKAVENVLLARFKSFGSKIPLRSVIAAIALASGAASIGIHSDNNQKKGVAALENPQTTTQAMPKPSVTPWQSMLPEDASTYYAEWFSGKETLEEKITKTLKLPKDSSFAAVALDSPARPMLYDNSGKIPLGTMDENRKDYRKEISDILKNNQIIAKNIAQYLERKGVANNSAEYLEALRLQSVPAKKEDGTDMTFRDYDNRIRKLELLVQPKP